jgi:DNA-binding transcriptional LysR family regulator
MALDLESVRMFLRVAELASFTRAAAQLGVPKSRVSQRVTALEDELGSRLLQRTTRAVRLTPDGEQLVARARPLIEEADAVAAMFKTAGDLRGRVRVDLPVGFARNLVIPRLPELLAQHPRLDLVLSTTDRLVDAVGEGFDCVLRVGELADSGLTARRLGALPMVNCASPAYLRRFGVPRSVADLAQHRLVHYAPNLSGDDASFECHDGARWVELPMARSITVNNTDAYLAACLAGLGIIQAPRVGPAASLASGALVEVLPELTARPMPVTLLHTHGRGAPKRVRAVLAFLASALEPALAVVPR